MEYLRIRLNEYLFDLFIFIFYLFFCVKKALKNLFKAQLFYKKYICNHNSLFP